VTRFVSWLEVALRVASLLLFPAVAVRVARGGGVTRLWRCSGFALGLILLFAVFVASTAGGNVLAPVYGYRYTLPPVLLLHGLTLGLPIVATTLIVHVLAGRLPSRLGLYAVGVLGAAVAWVLGVAAATGLIFALAR
jgi:hypothetical protein